MGSGLVVLAEEGTVPLSQHVEPADVEEMFACVRVADWQGHGEVELDPVVLSEENGPDDVVLERVLDEIVDQGEESPLEGLQAFLRRLEVAVGQGEMVQAEGDGIVRGKLVLVVGSAGDLQAEGEDGPDVEMLGTVLLHHLVDVLAAPDGWTPLVVGQHRVVNVFWEAHPLVPC